jgi:hypothetical protein
LKKPSYSNGGVYADLDNDGDLDVVINNIDEPAMVYQNHSESLNPKNYLRISLEGPAQNRQGLGTEVWIHTKNGVQYQYYSPFRGYISSVDTRMHFGLDSLQQIDRLLVRWPDGKQQEIKNLQLNQQLTLNYNQASFNNSVDPGSPTTLFRALPDSLSASFVHQENLFVDYKTQPTLPHLHSRNGPGISIGLVNQDSLWDFYVGGAFSQPGALYLQNPQGGFDHSPQTIDSLYEDMGSLFFDADLDGDQDLYVVSGGVAPFLGSERYQDRLYLNDGQGGLTLQPHALPSLVESGSTVVAADYDRDGDLDLFVGGRLQPGSYPLSPQSYVLINQWQESRSVRFEKAPMPAEFTQMGMVTGALWTDFNNDDWVDLIVVGEFMPIRFFENQKGTLTEVTLSTGLESTHGWWNSITQGDFDNDGDMDYMVGNLGLNSRYKASADQPLCIYAQDFDKNGRIDPIMCYYIDGKNYVAHTRDDLIDQINAMRARFKTYADYAEVTFEESFLPEELANAEVVKSETFASSYLENLGNGQFQISPLPLKAQFGPLYGMIAEDVNGDHHLDLLAVGNFYSSEVSIGRYDALTGLILLGNGKGAFEPMDLSDSGFLVDRDAKGFVRLPHGDDKTMLLVSNNNDRLQSFVSNSKTTYLPVDHMVSYALIHLQDGTHYRHEFAYGSTYLSNSARVLKWHEDITQVKLYHYDGTQQILNKP